MLRNFARSKKLPIAVGVTLGVGGALWSTNRLINAEPRAPGILNPKKWIPIPLESSRDISHDTKELTFKLPEGYILGGTVAFSTQFRFDKDGEEVVRPYTPTSSPETTGRATYVIKKMPFGAMSTHMHDLKPGQTIEINGPIEEYHLEPNSHEQIGLIGGGSGITPLYQILQKVASNPDDKTKVSLFYGNKSPEDILLKKEIDDTVAKKPDQFSVTYFVDKCTDKNFKGVQGFITRAFLKDHLFGPDAHNVKIFVCGPPPLLDAIAGYTNGPDDQGDLDGVLKELGFHESQVYKFDSM